LPKPRSGGSGGYIYVLTKKSFKENFVREGAFSVEANGGNGYNGYYGGSGGVIILDGL
jgi:hypothetical protein